MDPEEVKKERLSKEEELKYKIQSIENEIRSIEIELERINDLINEAYEEREKGKDVLRDITSSFEERERWTQKLKAKRNELIKLKGTDKPQEPDEQTRKTIAINKGLNMAIRPGSKVRKSSVTAKKRKSEVEQSKPILWKKREYKK